MPRRELAPVEEKELPLYRSGLLIFQSCLMSTLLCVFNQIDYGFQLLLSVIWKINIFFLEVQVCGLGWSYLPTKAILRSSSARSIDFCVITWGPWELTHEHLRTIFTWNLKRFSFNSEFNLRTTSVTSLFYAIYAENTNLPIQIPLRLLRQGKACRYWTALGCNEWLQMVPGSTGVWQTGATNPAC